MQKILRNGSVLTYSAVHPPCIAQIQRRFVSRNTAIARGLRQGVSAANNDRKDHQGWESDSWVGKPKKWEEKPQKWERPKTGEKRPYQREQHHQGPARGRRQELDSTSDERGPHSHEEHERPQSHREYEKPHSYREQWSPQSSRVDAPLGFNVPVTKSPPPIRKDRHDERTPPSPPKSYAYSGPVSIPFTTAASEFLYGYNPVCAALKAQRRKLYKIYLHPRVASRDGDAEVNSIRQLATTANVDIVNVDDGWLKVMDKMSDDRPHNGVVLEVSPLPRLPVTALGTIEVGEVGEEKHINLELGFQTREQIDINGGISRVSYKADLWRSPFVLFIDDVLNPGNLGAIIRSAYFLGVDAIIISTRTCAPLNSEAVKASAGAIEAIPILAVDDVETFLRNSATNAGWRIYCATTPDPKVSTIFTSAKGSLAFTKQKNTARPPLGEKLVDTFSSPLGAGQPVILAIGGEQRGLSRAITRNAFAIVQIMPGINQQDVGVDSLNVSAASAVLCAEFMRAAPPAFEASVSRSGRGIKRWSPAVSLELAA